MDFTPTFAGSKRDEENCLPCKQLIRRLVQQFERWFANADKTKARFHTYLLIYLSLFVVIFSEHIVLM